MTAGIMRRLAATLFLALAGLAAPLAFLLAAAAPANAQFFEDRFPFDPFRRPPPYYRQDAPRLPPPDNSKAPAANKKADTEPQTSVVVVGFFSTIVHLFVFTSWTM